MSHNRRMLTYVAIALIVGAALALAVALASSGAAGDTSGASSGGVEATASGLYSDDGEAALAAADPAREQPLLDKFVSKDPFIPFPTPGATVAPTSSPNPNPTSTAAPTNLSAKIKVDGTNYTVTQGDKVPGGSAAEFTVTGVSSGDVTFQVIDGSLENGNGSFSVNLGEAVRVTLESGVSYDISVVSIGSSSGGGGSGGGGSASHSISVLSINSQNGVAVATFEVDGKTYSDKQQGDVFSTSWGEIEVLSINVGAQTVTILHGDQTLTLHAGQVIIK
jgi:hypothetical protein